MPHKLISIESRKGGVGKTTVALNLASILVKKGPVLLLDCDITGTSIVDPAKNSSFWKSTTNVLASVNEKGEKEDINLIRFFLEHFIKGDGNVQDFIKQDKLVSSKVNVLGSSLYGTSKEAATNSSWLMQELHSYWMVEFVRQIVEAFEALYADRVVYIIVDNSPGYTTFSQALHDFMYDEGPINAKYLLVSTLDSQDLMANLETAEEIDNAIKKRTIAAKYFEAKKEDESGTNRDPEAEMLIETERDIKGFFLQLIDKDDLLETYTKEYHPSDYLALVLNKIPQSLQDSNTTVNYKDIVGERMSFLSLISGSNGKSDPKNLVFYDEAIVYQYYIRYLQGRPNARSSTASYWTRRFREIEQQAREVSLIAPLDGMARLNACFVSLQTSLVQHEQTQIAKQFEMSWAPNYAINRLKKELSSAFAKQPISYDIPSQKMKEMLHMWNLKLLQDFKKEEVISRADLMILENLIDYLESFAGFKDEKRQADLMVWVSLLLFVFCHSILQRQDEIQPKRLVSMRDYCQGEHLRSAKKAVDAEKDIVINSEVVLKSAWLKMLLGSNFGLPYYCFCYTILRLAEQNEDFLFILAAIRLYVPSIPPSSFSKEMKDYITDVVVRKKEIHNNDKLVEVATNSYVMKNMQDVLRDIVNKAWK